MLRGMQHINHFEAAGTVLTAQKVGGFVQGNPPFPDPSVSDMGATQESNHESTQNQLFFA